MAITKVGSDVAATNGTAKPHTFSHTQVSTTNGLVVVFAGIENANETGTWTITYGGNAASGIIEAQQGAGFADNAIVAYWFQAALPAGTGSRTVSVDFSGTAGSLEISAFCAQYEGVNQALKASDADNQTTGATITSTVSIAAGDLVVSAVGNGNTGTFTHNNSQAELVDFNDSSSCFAAAELIATGTLSSVTSTVTGTVNRYVRACAVFAEVSGAAPQESIYAIRQPPVPVNRPF